MYFGDLVVLVLEEDERLAVLLVLISLAELLILYFAASVAMVLLAKSSVALGAFSFVASLVMVSRIQGVKVDRLVKMPANNMFSFHLCLNISV